MFRLAAGSARFAYLSISTVVLTLLFASGALAGAGPRNVCVVINAQSATSREIGSYYTQARNIPYTNVCTINCSTTELITRTECETNILAPIRTFLQNPAVSDHIDYIVLTKGVPLGADYGYSTGPLSITSILTCITEPGVTKYLYNPYGPVYGPAVETAFSHQTSFNGYHLYLVTRLDAFTIQEVKDMIDRSQMPSPLGTILLDAKPGVDVLNTRLLDARNKLLSRGIPTVYDDTAAFLANYSGLMGYFSWGSNDSSYTYSAYVSNSFVPGSIADTFVSTSGRTFSPTSTGQSLIADLITKGACGVNGFVSEPYVAYASYPSVLFDRYTRGFNLAESFYAACPLLFWKSVVIGDPLMAPYATAPVVALQFPALPFTGIATINATAMDPEGIAKVEFYFDGELIGTCTSPPYTVQIDSTTYSVAQHRVEARATDAGPVSTEGSTTATVNVVNQVSTLRVIADAFCSPDGQPIRTLPKTVTAGTGEMGGSEFYIEEPSRACGIRVASTVPVQEGDVVVISGSLITTSGERSIKADNVELQQTGAAIPSPATMGNNLIGGGDICATTRGVTGGLGARNIGLLVKTWGKTSYIGGGNEDFFYIDDASKLNDGSGHLGIKIRCRGCVKPPLGVSVLITGISSCEDTGTRIIPTIKIRRQSDITVITQ